MTEYDREVVFALNRLVVSNIHIGFFLY